jgi:predicted molibdopterin-dependent oxidoreductase YjgC
MGKLCLTEETLLDSIYNSSRVKYTIKRVNGNRDCYHPYNQHRSIKALKEQNSNLKAELWPKTAERFEVKGGDAIITETDRGQLKIKANASERVAEGVSLVSHERPGEANANLLNDTRCCEAIMEYLEMKSLFAALEKPKREEENDGD